MSTPFSSDPGKPATTAEPEVGSIKALRVRTVVVLPAPLGPRNPKTSPRWTLNSLLKAVRSPNLW